MNSILSKAHRFGGFVSQSVKADVRLVRDLVLSILILLTFRLTEEHLRRDARVAGCDENPFSPIRSNVNGINIFKDDDSKKNIDDTSKTKLKDFTPSGSMISRACRVFGHALSPRHGKSLRYLLLTSVLLFFRILLNIRITKFLSEMHGTIVGGDLPGFVQAIKFFFAWAVPFVASTASIRYVQQRLEISMRRELLNVLHSRYMKSDVFYSVAASVPFVPYKGRDGNQQKKESRKRAEAMTRVEAVSSPDERMTGDVDLLVHGSVQFYTTVFKSLGSLIVSVVKASNPTASSLSGSLGGYRTPALLLVYFSFMTYMVHLFAPSRHIARAAEQHQQFEAELRSAQQHVARNVTNIAGYPGGELILREKVATLANRATRHQSALASRVARHDFLQQLSSNLSSLATYIIPIISTFLGSGRRSKFSEASGYFELQATLMNIANSLSDLTAARRHLGPIIGHLRRVDDLIQSFDGHRYTHRLSGVIPVLSTEIDVRNVCLRTPNNAIVLARRLTFHVRPGMNLLILGPNGSGKSSIFRMLGGLWSLGGKHLRSAFIGRPRDMCYVPQRSFLLKEASLRDQLLYPRRYIEVNDASASESRLIKCLGAAGFEDALDTLACGDFAQRFTWETSAEAGGDAELNDDDDVYGKEQNEVSLGMASIVLSHGQEQKLAMARMFVQSPRFALLDECSASISEATEQHWYESCAMEGITVLSIAHRKSSWQFHSFVLYLDGNGGSIFSPMTVGEESLHMKEIIASDDPRLIGKSRSISLESLAAELLEAPVSVNQK